jgi:DNA polymerase V
MEAVPTPQQRMYLCIDGKSFYASVECAERGLNPFETCLVVADPGRGKNALCLAISPKMKALGVHNRCRLSDIPGNIKYEIALPRMQLYVDYCADIYALYLDYIAAEDIHVYSIDEAFLDITSYLKTYHTDARSFAKFLMNEIADKLHIPTTAGIGTNLFLAKIALDITAKHAKDHLGYLDEELFKQTLWDHQPLTDFWGIAKGKAQRLSRYGIFTMRGIAEAPQELLYKTFGKDAELLIDHAWGRETCLMEDIKKYRSKSHSVSFSQILPRDYAYDEAAVVMAEMAIHGCLELYKRHVITQKLWIGIGYSRYEMYPPAQASIKLKCATQLASIIEPAVRQKFSEIAARGVPIRHLAISFGDVRDEGCEGYDLFTDWAAVDKEKAVERTVLEIRDRFGKNAVLRGINLNKAGTQRERNGFIGGHRAGYDDPRKPR